MAANIFLGIGIGMHQFFFSHHFFVDDVIIMVEWNKENVMNIVNILQCFYLVSGLKIAYNNC